MSIALVQSTLGSNASQSIGPAGGSFSTPSANFPGTTTAGNLVLCQIGFTDTVSAGSGFRSESSIPATTGVSWSFIGSCAANSASKRTDSFLYAVPNCPGSMNSTVINYVGSAQSGLTSAIVVEFALYEFSGVSTSTSLAVPGPLIDAEALKNNQVSSVPNAGNVTTLTSDLIAVIYSATTGAPTIGGGYSLGQAMSTAQFIGLQYLLNSSVGSISTAFSAGSQAIWGSFAAAFKPASAPPFTGTSVNWGYIFG